MMPPIVERFAEMFREYDHNKATALMWDFLPYSLALSFLYVVVIFTLKHWMRDREPFNLKWPLVFWNASLAIFSAMGSYYSTIDVYEMAAEHNSWSATYCELGTALTGKNGIWGLLFALSKVVEFGDTLFIVLRKKPLIFLHYYHHIVTLNFVVIGYAGNNTFSIWLLWLNYKVHTFMYLYYMISALGLRLPVVVSRTITIMQLSQFAISLFMFGHLGLLKYVYGYPCHFQDSAFILAVLMEISYVSLFAHFFHKAYVKNGGKRTASLKKKQ